jgi:ATP-binding cassette subfamily C (CFTR/MRP) protein 1
MISLAIVFSAPPVVALCLFSLYVNEEGFLEPTVAFTTLSLFNTLRFPLVVLPKSIKTVSEFIGSITRIQSFLVQPEFH